MAKSEGKGGLIQFVKFAVVGVSNTAVDWIVFKILILTVLTGLDTLAKAISFTVSVLNSYLWNTIWTFSGEYRKAIKGGGTRNKAFVFSKFFVVSLIGLGVNVSVYSLASRYVSYKILDKDLIPLIFASGSAVIWNFFANKFWTYRR